MSKNMTTEKDKFSTAELEFFAKVDAFAGLFRSGAKAAEALGLSEGTYNSYRYRLRHPKLANVSKLTAIMDSYLNQGDPDPQDHQANTIEADHSIGEVSCVRVPVIGEVGAGMPMEIWDQDPIEYISIIKEYNRPDLRVFRVGGDSMQPTIRRGAYVGVTPVTDVVLKEGRIYLCYQPPFGVVVKRVKPAPGNMVVLMSDNPEYDPIPISMTEYQRVVIGEVRWVMQML